MLRVLMVDDERYMLDRLLHIVEWKRYGFEEVRQCQDAMEALILLSQEMFQLVIVDLKMPKISGIQLIQEMKRRNQRALVIVLSNHEDYEQVSQAMKLGVFDYCVKQYLNQEEMHAILTRVCACYSTNDLCERTGPFLLYYLTLPKKTSIEQRLVVEAMIQRTFLGCELIHLNENRLVVLIEKSEIFHEVSCFDYWLNFREQLKHELDLDISISRGISLEMLDELGEYLKVGIASHPCAYRLEIFNVLSYIHQHYRERISNQQLASVACLNESYLARLFKRETERTISTYINELRMYKAKELLKSPTIKIKEVAYQVGIQDQLYFNRIFNRQCGMSPKGYQEKMKLDGII